MKFFFQVKLMACVLLGSLAFVFGCSFSGKTKDSSVRESVPDRVHIDKELLDRVEEDGGGKSKLSIVVYTLTQTGELLSHGSRVMEFPVSTGKQGHSTPLGNFSIYNKERENESSLYGSIYNAEGVVTVPHADSRKDKVPKGGKFKGASMPYTMHFTGYCAFHEGVVPYPAKKASHGCIRLTPDVAELLFLLCPVGTPVSVKL